MTEMTAAEAAFRLVFDNDVTEAEPRYVSLYVDVPFYGGPEEGGWWGTDTELVAYHKCSCSEVADAKAAEIQELADELSRDAKSAFNRMCARQCEWLEERGLDSDYLREVDGESRYWVAVEDQPGRCVLEGDRSYS